MSKNETTIFASFLNLLKVKHTRVFSNKYFNEHPHKYNLFGISKMLLDYGVKNAGAKIENKEEDIFNIELPFIANFSGDFVAVHKIENTNGNGCTQGEAPCFCNGISQGCKTLKKCCQLCGVQC
jgi:hypothetical protein